MTSKMQNRGATWIRRWVEAVLSVVFPAHCPFCGAFAPTLATRSICSDCWDAVEPVPVPACRRCGVPLTVDTETLCLSCRHIPPPFQATVAFALYRNRARDLIHLLKFQRRPDIATLMARRLIRGLRDPGVLYSIDLVVPVPLHSKRRRQRGYNQAELLARVVARTTGKGLLTGVLVRRRHTVPQSGLTDAQREKNVRGAFQVPARLRSKITGKRLLLVDDVFTTGATMAACTRELLAAGASEVTCLTFARVPHAGDAGVVPPAWEPPELRAAL